MRRTAAQNRTYTDAVLVIKDALNVLTPDQRHEAIKEAFKMALPLSEAHALAGRIEREFYMEKRHDTR